MAAGVIRLTRLRGRNRFDPPLSIPDDQCYECFNIEPWGNSIGEMRQGSVSIGTTFSSGGPWSGSIGSLLRHVPGSDETAAELWAIDGNSTSRFGRMAAASTFAQVTLVDNLASVPDALNVTGASMPNGFFFLAYKSGINRLHVWDPTLSKVRRVGIATPNTPTAADSGGVGLSFTRYYRVRDVDVSGSDVRRRSEASAVRSITIANKSGVTVTKGAATGEDETHWELEAADSATGPWYRIARTAIATTTYNDTSATIDTSTVAPQDGINYPPPSAQFLLGTDARLIMAGAFETSGGYVTPKTSRVWFTPVIGDTDVGDWERIPTGRYLDMDAPVTALAGPLQGAIYVFSYRRIWKLVPTGDASAPYAKYSVSDAVGCIRQQTVVTAEDENGNPAIYFLSHRGPYRIGVNGLQYLGTDSVDKFGTLVETGSHCVYHQTKRQVWYFINDNTANGYSAYRLRFSIPHGQAQSDGTVRGGWFLDSTTSAAGQAYASVMFSNTVGATMSRDLKPYIAQAGGTGLIWRCDADNTYTDNGNAYGASIQTKEYAPIGISSLTFWTFDPWVVLKGDGNAAHFNVAVAADFGMPNTSVGDKTGVINYTSSAHFIARIDDTGLGDCTTVGFRLGNLDGNTATYFKLEAFEVPFRSGPV